ncbi:MULTISPECIES: DUF305 domain-containing protein [Flavobacterium]|jgi:hypothetical protein|uniref:DUF305 domain-containing protein n=3 Tax=Flavobacterium TaxID=237 RepID=A0A7W7IY26_9FLAO|nr:MULTISPECIES: DUF305 domain-containing protein [Flavobacterium]MBB4802555.1 hypothetical protein [Flavobacterium nitrogenifigens]MBB6387513.1 hypothetical protein [Flavobacterium notoginsengisoli]MBZ4040908.1 DUF305 domain-containing protein [Flavobacterium hibisci]MCR4029528.1 DUF305 domain-containing protein [Flavobacterium panacis]RED26972.1 protein of unknown function (DUF305) [Flavobacterium cutihirudinis]
MKTEHTTKHSEELNLEMYKKLALMAVLSFISMYVLMYSMVDVFANAIPNLNQFYMAALMTMPMLIIEIIVMRTMYMNKMWNKVILAAGSLALVIFFSCIRQQAAVDDKQFLKSMIPHHAAAILMAQKTVLQDPETSQLAKNIIKAQQAEIAQMKAKLNEMEKK